MAKIVLSRKLTIKDHLRTLKTLLIVGNLIALLLFICIRVVFLNSPFSQDDLSALAAALLVGSTSAFGISLFIAVSEIADHLSSIKINYTSIIRTVSIASFLCLTIYLASCKPNFKTGVAKDLNTGMVTTYKNMEPQKTMLIMNKEIINHTDIPLGEAFVLVNEMVKGLTVKDGKVILGCSLVITSMDGKTLLNNPDLFAGKNVFSKEDAEILRCTVSTGSPMEYDQNYKVHITFGDKQGKGTLEHDFAIHMIDIP